MVFQVRGDLLRLREEMGVGDFFFAPIDGDLLWILLGAVLESDGQVHIAKLVDGGDRVKHKVNSAGIPVWSAGFPAAL